MTGDISVGREAPDFGVAASLGISGRCQAVNPVYGSGAGAYLSCRGSSIKVACKNQARRY